MLLELILWAVMSGGIVVEYGKQPLDVGLMEQVSTQTIHHSGFSSGDRKQLAIQKAYDLWWIEFVTMIECENWNRSPEARWDKGHAHWLCQMNDRYHKIPDEYFNSREFQLEYCYEKWSTWTRFYWPDRKVKGMKCKDYVLNRFIIGWNERKT